MAAALLAHRRTKVDECMAAALLAHRRARVGPLNTVQEFPRGKRHHSPQQAEEKKRKSPK